MVLFQAFQQISIEYSGIHIIEVNMGMQNRVSWLSCW